MSGPISCNLPFIHKHTRKEKLLTVINVGYSICSLFHWVSRGDPKVRLKSAEWNATTCWTPPIAMATLISYWVEPHPALWVTCSVGTAVVLEGCSRLVAGLLAPLPEVVGGVVKDLGYWDRAAVLKEDCSLAEIGFGNGKLEWNLKVTRTGPHGNCSLSGLMYSVILRYLCTVFSLNSTSSWTVFFIRIMLNCYYHFAFFEDTFILVLYSFIYWGVNVNYFLQKHPAPVSVLGLLRCFLLWYQTKNCSCCALLKLGGFFNNKASRTPAAYM